jgi:hypothetical protein
MPPTTDPLSRNFLDETFVWILADNKEREKERQALWTHTGPETCYGPSSNIPFRARGMADRKHRPLIRLGSL